MQSLFQKGKAENVNDIGKNDTCLELIRRQNVTGVEQLQGEFSFKTFEQFKFKCFGRVIVFNISAADVYCFFNFGKINRREFFGN
jgi:hypothetical protein